MNSLLLVFKPLLHLAKLPDALSNLGLLCIDYVANAMLHAVDPLPFILAPVRVGVRSSAMLLVEPVLAFVLAAVLPHIVTLSVHHPVLEFTFKVATISPLEAAKSAHLVVSPLARVLRTICPEVAALTLFDSTLEVSVVIAPV